MTTIDHRILIPAAPDVVWDFISDITRNPQWQVDCFEVIFLTSKRDGPGLRWRYSTPSGSEFVIAVTAWYNGLGYEYYFVDGVPFRENKGRIRLQEIPEGTIVQWTFTYELGGVLGGVRNAMGMSRQINRTIADSLKTLWQQIKETSGGRSHEAKSLMRDAPDVEARSAYQPRHPSALAQGEEREAVSGEVPEVTQPTSAVAESDVAEPPISDDDGQAIRVIAEPPISDEDTRPRQPVTPLAVSSQPATPIGEADVPASAIPPDLDEEPEFLTDLSRFEPPRDPSDTQPRRAVQTPAEAPTTPDQVEQEPSAETTERSPFARPVEKSEESAASAEETEALTFKPPEILLDYLPSTESLEAANIESDMYDEVEAEAPKNALSAESDEAIGTVSAAAIGEVAPSDEREAEVDESSGDVTQTAAESHAAAPTEPSVEPVVETTTTTIAEPEVSDSDSKSIWEVFGVPRPSETQETEAAAPVAPPESESPAASKHEAEPTAPSMPAVATETSPTDAAEAAEPVPPALTLEPYAAVSLPALPTRTGLRIILRRKLVHLRRPTIMS